MVQLDALFYPIFLDRLFNVKLFRGRFNQQQIVLRSSYSAMNCSRTVHPFRLNGEGVSCNGKGCSLFVSFHKNGTITLYCHITIADVALCGTRNTNVLILFYNCDTMFDARSPFISPHSPHSLFVAIANPKCRFGWPCTLSIWRSASSAPWTPWLHGNPSSARLSAQSLSSAATGNYTFRTARTCQ